MHPCGSHAIIGKKGGGKSMLATKLTTRVLAETPRLVVTNLPLRVAEFREYMPLHWPAWTDDPAKRIEMIEDVHLLKRFWLYRGDRWTVPDVSKEDWNKGARLDYRHAYRWIETTEDVSHRTPIVDLNRNEIKIFLTSGELEQRHIRDLPPVQYVIDEIQNIFPARGFMQTSQGCLFWLSQQRKLGDDLIWISQNSDLVDKEFRDLTDDWLYITNWGRKRKSVFRLPKVMTWAKYDQRPGPGVSPMVQGSFRLDVNGIGKLYDTSAGVGIEGGLTADTKEGIGGIHWTWFLLVVAALMVGVFFAPKLASKFATGLISVRPKPTVQISGNPAPQETQPAPPATTTTKPPAPAAAPHLPTKAPSNTPPHLVGICALPRGSAAAFLSDGTTIDNYSPRWGGWIRRADGRIRGAMIDGVPMDVR